MKYRLYSCAITLGIIISVTLTASKTEAYTFCISGDPAQKVSIATSSNPDMLTPLFDSGFEDDNG